MATEVFCSALRWVQLVVDAIPAIGAFFGALTGDRSTVADKVNFVAQTSFVAAQAAHAIGHVSSFSPEVRLTAHIAATVLDVTRTVTEIVAKNRSLNDNATQIVEVAACRGLNLAIATVDKHPEVCCGYDCTVRNGLTVLRTGLTVFMNRENIKRLECRVFHAFSSRAEGSSCAESSVRIPPNVLREAATMIRQGNTGNIDERIQRTQALFFDEFICPIRRLPISKVVVPNMEESGSMPMYDRSAIEAWVREKPNEVPPEWPVNILSLPVRMEQLRPFSFIQSMIDRKWQSLAVILEERALVEEHSGECLPQ